MNPTEHPGTTAWPSGPMLAVTVVTTIPDPESSTVVGAAVVAISDGKAPKVTKWLVDPGHDAPAWAAPRDRIVADEARRAGRPPSEALPEIVTALTQALREGIPLVAIEAPYVLTPLSRQCAREGVEFPAEAELAPVLDPAVLHRLVAGIDGPSTLPALCEKYGTPYTGTPTVAQEALAIARLTRRLGRLYPGLGTATLPDLHALQVKAAPAQVERLRRDLTTTGRVHGWPLLPTP